MEYRVRGHVINGVYEYFDSHCPAERRQELNALLPAGLREVAGNGKPGAWHPLSYFEALNHAIAALGKTEDESRLHIDGAAEHLAKQSLNTFMKLLLRMLTPALFVRKFPVFYSRDLDTGTRISVDLQLDRGHLTCSFENNTVVHAPPFSAGFIRTIFGAVIGTPVRVESAGPWSMAEPTPVSFRDELRWTPPPG